MSQPEKTLDRFWDMPLRDLLELLEATPAGLSSAESKRRHRLHGPNRLEKESRFAALPGFLRFFANPLVLILLAAIAISISLRDPVGGSIIIAIVLLSVIVNFHVDVRDPDGGQPVPEPSERAVADRGRCRLACRRCAAGHAPRRRTWIYPVTAVIADCFERLSSRSSSRRMIIHELEGNGDCEPDIRVPAVVKIVPVVVIDVDVIGGIPIVCPVFRPGVHQQEGVSTVRETRISHVDPGESPHPEQVATPEVDRETGLRNVVTAIAAALRPATMFGFPAAGAILPPGAVPLPAALLDPPPLLLPRDSLLLCTARLLLLSLLGPLWLLPPGLLGPLPLLLLLLLPGLLGPLLLLLFLLLPGLLGPLLLLLLLSGLLAPLLPLAPLPLTALIRLPLRALLLCGWRRTLPPAILPSFRLAALVVLLVLLRVRRDSRPEKQKQSSGAGSSTELHSNCLR